MKTVLIIAATYPEIKFLEKAGMKAIKKAHNLYTFIKNDTTFVVLITGVGMVATAFHLTLRLSKYTYDLVLNVGIAGAFDKTILLGEVVNITEDCFADLGAEDDENFISAFDLRLMDANKFPFENGVLKNKTTTDLNAINNLKKVKSISVNKVHGNEKNINKTLSQLETQNFKPETESMEGAAFTYVCMMLNIDHFQVRAISNYVEKRNRNAWKIEIALLSLEKFVMNLIDDISECKFPSSFKQQ